MKTTNTPAAVATSRKPLRLWPGVIAAFSIVLFSYALPLVAPGGNAYGVLASFAGGVAIILWWLFFSRARWVERIGAVVLIVCAALATRLLADPSIRGGMMGMLLPVYALPSTLGPIFVLWAVVTRGRPATLRRGTMVLAVVLGCGVWTLARTDGIRGEAGSDFAWRWTPTAEERLLARGEALPRPPAQDRQAPAAPAPVDTGAPPSTGRVPAPPSGEPSSKRAEPRAVSAPPAAPVAWPGFRGPARDSAVSGIRFATDWSATQPAELWRRPIGPGWSSFAIEGNVVFTQEQRGEEEVVSAYRLNTGDPVWRHGDPVRFYESNGGAGPRATPTVQDGHVYSLGATGILNALDARTGARIWTRDAQADTDAPRPGWGFAGSPLVVDGVLIVATSGRLAAYARDSGELRWTRPTGGGGYSSPHYATIDGVPQVLLMSGGGVTSVAPTDGAVLWESRGVDGVSIVQPALAEDGDILVAAGDMMGGSGIRRIGASRSGDSWNVAERWTTRGLKPYFNDFVVHNGHAYGFDGTILSCIELASGERRWKGGRYGAGQMMLLREQNVLLVLSEDGELVLVAATPDKHSELTRFKAIEGKTWNHPVLTGDVLLVRNGEEMAAFRLPLAR